jgi:hypothetical protein
MILSTILGNQKIINNDWSIVTDDYGNKFIANDSIRQRIRLGKNVKDELTKVFSSANMAGYELADVTSVDESKVGESSGYDCAKKIIFSNSNKNMNLSLINFWSKNKKDMNDHEDTNLLYLTLVSSNYKMISYELAQNVQIIQTYRKGITKTDKNDEQSEAYQGCAIEFSENGYELIHIKAKDFKANRFVELVVATDETGRVIVNKTIIEDKAETKNLNTQFGKLKNRMVHFAMTCPAGYLPTSTFIVDGSNEDLVDDVVKMVEPIANACVLSLPAGNSTFNNPTEYTTEAIDQLFTERLLNERIRAVTTVGIKLPYDFCKKYKILYIFDLNPNTGEIVCVRSN